MASKAFLSFFLIFSSSIHLCFSGGLDQLLSGIDQSALLKDTQCMQKMLPCKPYVKNPNNPPPACCGPMTEMATNSTDCLCNLIDNPDLLQSFNVSKDDAMKLPKACGVDVDFSKCNNTATSSPPADSSSPPAGSSSSTPADSSSSTPKGDSIAPADNTSKDSSEDSTSSTKMITPFGIIHFGVPGFVALLTALVFHAY